MPITIQNSAGGGVTLDSTTTSNETVNLPTGGGTLITTSGGTMTGALVINSPNQATGGSALKIRQGNATTFGIDMGLSQTDGHLNISRVNSGTSTHMMTLARDSGNVSIGSPTSTDKRLNVKGPVNEHIAIFQTATNGYAVLFRNSANTNVGSIAVNASSTTYATSSDYRLKEDDVPMTGATERVKALRPINFAWKADGSRVDGFFAHELAEVVPEAATGTKDAMMDEEYEVTPATDTEAAVMGTRSVPDLQGIDQSKLVPLLTATIQELIARIEALENV